MLTKILYQILALALTILIIGLVGDFFSNKTAYFISFFLVLIGFLLYPEKKNFGSKTGMLLFPILAVIAFNINLSVTAKEFPLGVILINSLVGVFCLASNFLKKRKER